MAAELDTTLLGNTMCPEQKDVPSKASPEINLQQTSLWMKNHVCFDRSLGMSSMLTAAGVSL